MTLIVLMNEADNKHYYRTFHGLRRKDPKDTNFTQSLNERCTDVNMVFKMCAALYETFW